MQLLDLRRRAIARGYRDRPGDNIDEILAILEKHALRVKAIVITHAHIDHIGGAAKLKAATGARF